MPTTPLFPSEFHGIKHAPLERSQTLTIILNPGQNIVHIIREHPPPIQHCLNQSSNTLKRHLLVMRRGIPFQTLLDTFDEVVAVGCETIDSEDGGVGAVFFVRIE